jgi:hypothetical protein
LINDKVLWVIYGAILSPLKISFPGPPVPPNPEEPLKGMGMKELKRPEKRSDLLLFYLKNIGEPEPIIYQIMDKAHSRALPQLKKLCANDNEQMVRVLEAVSLIPLIRVAKKELGSRVRKEQKVKSQDLRRFKEKLKESVINSISILKGLDPEIDYIKILVQAMHAINNNLELIFEKYKKEKKRKEFYRAISIINALVPDIDQKKLKKRADQVVDFSFDDALNEILPSDMRKTIQSFNHNKMVNHIIFLIYSISKKATNATSNAIYNLIANFLTSIDIQNTRNSNYTRSSIYNIIQTIPHSTS